MSSRASAPFPDVQPLNPRPASDRGAERRRLSTYSPSDPSNTSKPLLTTKTAFYAAAALAIGSGLYSRSLRSKVHLLEEELQKLKDSALSANEAPPAIATHTDLLDPSQQPKVELEACESRLALATEDIERLTKQVADLEKQLEDVRGNKSSQV